MRYNNTASEKYKSYLGQSSVESYFTVQIDVSNGAGTDYIYITNSTSAQHPVAATVYDNLLDFYGSTTQGLNFSSRISSIGNLIVKLIDEDKVFNDAIIAMEANGYSLTDAEIVVYEGFDDMTWSEYVVGRAGYIKKYKWQNGGYSIEAKDAQLLLNKKIFQEKSTSLIQPISDTDTFLQFTDISGWEPVEHSNHFTDGLSYATNGGSAYCTGNGTAYVTTTNVSIRSLMSDGDRIDINGTDYIIDEIVGDNGFYLTTTLAAGTYDFQIYPKYIYLKIDDEKIRCPYGFMDFTNHTASNVVRGALGTSAKKHSPGADQLVRNGSFINLGSRWFYLNWTISTTQQKITHDTGNVNPLYQEIDSLAENTIYTVQFNLFNRTAGTVTIELGGTSSAALSANQLHTVQITAGSNANKYLQFTPSSDFDGSLDDITLVLTRVSSDKLEVKQHVYLEMELVKCMKAILVGALENQTGENIPSYWEAGLAASNLDLSSLTDIGVDIWDATAETGVIIHFDGEKEQDCKQFLEQQLLIGMFMIVTGDNKLSLRRQAKSSAKTGGGVYFGAGNSAGTVIEVSELAHDTTQVWNRFSLQWEWSDVLEKYRRETDLIDATSVSKHGASDYKIVKFRGLKGSNHTTEYVTQLLENYHSAFSGTPSLLRIKVQFQATVLEVGDVVTLDMHHLQIDTPVDLGYMVSYYIDDNGNLAQNTETSIYQSFIVTRINTDPWEQVVTLDLYGATGDPDAVEPTGRTEVLDDSWYISQGGTDISTLAGYTTGGGIGNLTSDITLNGNVDGSNTSAIYYLDRPLTIDSGVTITGNKNLRFYIAGEINMNGTLDLSGGGDAGRVYSDGNQNNYADGWDDSTNNYVINEPVGYTSSSGGVKAYEYQGVLSLNVQAGAGRQGHTGSVEKLSLSNANPQIVSSTSFTPLNYDLRGVGGAAGGGVVQTLNGGLYSKRSNGGTGGDGGSGIMFVCRGLVFGIDGNITTSGDDGIVASGETNFSYLPDAVGGSGAGGAPGGIVIYLDGSGSTQPAFSGSNHIARYGATPVPTQTIQTWLGVDFRRLTDLTGYMTATPPPSNIDASQGMRLVKYLGDNNQKYTAPNPEGPKKISNLEVSSGTDYLKTLPDGTVVSGALVDWDGSLDKDVFRYEVYWRLNEFSPETNVLSITSTFPAVVTTDGDHGLVTGDKVFLLYIGYYALSGDRRVTVLTSTTFEVDDFDVTFIHTKSATAGGTVRRLQKDQPWTLGSSILAPNTESLLYGMFEDGGLYDFKVHAINIFWQASETISIAGQTITGKSVAPNPPTSVTVRSDPAGARLEWVCPSDLDMKIYEIYMSSANTIPPNPLYRVAASTAGTNQYYTIPLHEGTSKYFWIKGRDTSDLLSTSVASSPANYKRPLATIINPTATFHQATAPLGSNGDVWHNTTDDTFYRLDSQSAPLEKTTELQPSDNDISDFFGYDVSISTNGLIIVVSAVGWDGTGGSAQGAIYTFDWDGSSWNERSTILTASDAAASDSFGSGISLSGDGTVLAVGADKWDGAGGANQGAVYVFDWDGSSWNERSTILTASDADVSFFFGIRCDLSNDWLILAVGSDGWNPGAAANQGAVYVFDWDGSSWTERTTALTASDAAASDLFGVGLGLSNNGLTLIVGADGATSNEGAVYVFDYNGTSWVERSSILVASAPSTGDDFGIGTGVSSDSAVYVIGASGYGVNHGAIYVFSPNWQPISDQTGSHILETFSDDLVIDGDMERDDVLYWSGTSTIPSKDASTYKYGSQSLKITNTSRATQSLYNGDKLFVPVESLDTLEYRCWARSDGSVAVRLTIEFYQGDKSTYISELTLTHNTATWTQKTATGGTVPANARYMVVTCDLSASGTGYLDAIFIRRE